MTPLRLGALRIVSRLGQKQEWYAAHMAVFGIGKPTGEVRYIAAAFPHGCAKTTRIKVWKKRRGISSPIRQYNGDDEEIPIIYRCSGKIAPNLLERGFFCACAKPEMGIASRQTGRACHLLCTGNKPFRSLN
ncbi:phosphoenolpyruvate carboxykinase (GTP) [Ethanoligenens harbinense]|nr:phosphoenolpyruvate carboxykinase (GTP) [Ethanoligenens harbinense YUAN-3]AYF38731.1 phosphoenolpyruvate carboxykinase (GTP) [Ethanoligenens harbinense]AYF41478.1 phosphoenolpyruvate carboxykinase (GTP) [Ethanoligenens harbinense]